MGVASAAEVEPFLVVVNRLRGALRARSNRLLQWRETPQGRFAEVIGGTLHLVEFPEYAKLTVIYEATCDTDDGPRPVERGRRTVSVGSLAKAQRKALDLATRGIRGGPTHKEGQWIWDRVDLDRSRRMAVPNGELRISCPESGTPVLTHESSCGVELLAREDMADLERKALAYWQERTRKPLKVVVKGRVVKLRSLEVAGLIGYYADTDNSFVALVQAGDAFALFYVQGLYPRAFVRVSQAEAFSGEPFNVDELLAATRREAASPGPAANHGPAANQGPAANERKSASVVADEPAAEPETTPADAGPSARATCPPGCSPMSEAHRGQCQRYLKRLYRRLRGRGARKARELVLLILEALEWCRLDITGTRQEVHSELARMLERHLPGGDRNIRDCLDLLVKCSLLVRREDGTRCTFLFGQLHDPESELMRRINAEDAAEEAPGTASTPKRTVTNSDEKPRSASVPDQTETSRATATSPSTESAPSTGLNKADGTTNTMSAHIFRAFAPTPPQSPATLPVGSGESGESMTFRDVPILPKSSRSPDTSTRGFTDLVVVPIEPPDPEVEEAGPYTNGSRSDQGCS